MASLVDIFNPSFFMFLGILVLVVALLVVYFETKMREQNHKMASMLNLITCMADEMNLIKIHLSNHITNNVVGGTGPTFQPSNLETNDIHIIKTDLIPVSDDSESESESDNHSENSIEDDESDNGSESSSGSNSEDIEEIQNIIEIGDNSDIKVLKLNLSNINDIDIDDSKNVNDFEDLHELEDIEEDDDLSIDSVSVSSNDEDNVNENKNDNDNDEIDISKLNLKSINISSLEEIKNSTSVDYKKFTLSKLRSIVVEKELVVDSSKLKKNELLKLLGAE
jgi:hypothetical protein